MAALAEAGIQVAENPFSPPVPMVEAAASAALRASEPTSRGRPADCNTPSTCRRLLEGMQLVVWRIVDTKQTSHIRERMGNFEQPARSMTLLHPAIFEGTQAARSIALQRTACLCSRLVACQLDDMLFIWTRICCARTCCRGSAPS